MGLFYILKDQVPVPVESVLEWVPWFEVDENRIVKQEWLPDKYWVSTIFLGLNSSPIDSLPPVLFETMTFRNGNLVDGFRERYCTWDAAIAGHNEIVNQIKATCNK